MLDFLTNWALPLFGMFVGTSLALMYVGQRRAPAEETFRLVAFSGPEVEYTPARNTFLDNYFSTLTEYIQRANKTIIVLDYLAHHRSLNAQDDPELVGCYEKYFRAIEDVVLTRGIKYIRIAQLPLPTSSGDREVKIAESLSMMFVETFVHIDRMLCSEADFEYFVLDAAFRPYSLMIIDDEVIITEYDRYNAQGRSEADHLIANCAKNERGVTSAEVVRLIEIQRDWCRRLIRREKPVSIQEFGKFSEDIEPRRLRDVELSLSLSEEEYRQLMSSRVLDPMAIRHVRLYNREDVRKNSRGASKKLELIQRQHADMIKEMEAS